MVWLVVVAGVGLILSIATTLTWAQTPVAPPDVSPTPVATVVTTPTPVTTQIPIHISGQIFAWYFDPEGPNILLGVVYFLLGCTGALVTVYLFLGEFLPSMGGKTEYRLTKIELEEFKKRRGYEYATWSGPDSDNDHDAVSGSLNVVEWLGASCPMSYGLVYFAEGHIPYFDVLTDNALFCDGFESGDVSLWTFSAISPPGARTRRILAWRPSPRTVRGAARSSPSGSSENRIPSVPAGNARGG